MSIPNGVYPTMLTPYTLDNKIDYNAVEQLINWYAEKGVDGIFAICQSSEIFYLSFEEKYELLKFIVSHVPDGMTVVASGHTSNNIGIALYEAQKYIDLGVDGYVFISNRLAEKNDSDDVFLRNIEVFMDEIPDISFGIYECPYPYKRLITTGVMGELARTGRFTFLKDTCCDPDQIRAKSDAVRGTPFKIFNANAATLLETLKFGCNGYSGVMANFHPEIYSWLCKNFREYPEKAELVSAALGFMSVAERQIYPVNAKYYLQLEGLDIQVLSRAKDAKDFTLSCRREIEQLHVLTEFLKDRLEIK